MPGQERQELLDEHALRVATVRAGVPVVVPAVGGGDRHGRSPVPAGTGLEPVEVQPAAEAAPVVAAVPVE
ncbi:hypothetical protein [Curtobacterium sp. MMLR14_010]|uniref:hypothetical protein n=1 Tax=Curtobacterium sp. MMLR14_010 TaxID=1898743 RepID=UPI001113D291|nr:hypothetical protein [Curtobacterium sp. MMLR14_010]